MQETSLHAALKTWYARPGDLIEAPVDGYIIDLVRDDLLIEIQTGNFGHIKAKLCVLLAGHPVRLVYPLIRDKWIVRVGKDGKTQVGRRKSPKRGQLLDLFAELVSFPELLKYPQFEIDVLFVQVDEVWCDDGKGSWRRGHWSVQDRRLLSVLDHILLREPSDLLGLLPANLPCPFTNRDLTDALKTSRRRVQQMTWCLHKMGLLDKVGQRGRSILYQLSGYSPR